MHLCEKLDVQRQCQDGPGAFREHHLATPSGCGATDVGGILSAASFSIRRNNS
jgi:hypothetical protein